jgi:hypothetical protein
VFSFAECGGNAIGELAGICDKLGLDIVIYLPRYREITPFPVALALNGTMVDGADKFYDLWHGEEV